MRFSFVTSTASHVRVFYTLYDLFIEGKIREG